MNISKIMRKAIGYFVSQIMSKKKTITHLKRNSPNGRDFS